MLAIPPSGPRRGDRRSQPRPERQAEPAGRRSFPGTAELPGYLAALALLLLTVVFFWKLVTPLSGMRQWLWEDFIHQNYPYRVFAATSLARGIFPFWNPYVFGGQPFFADIQTAVLYPFNLLQTLWAFDGDLSPYLVQLVEVLHYFLAGWFTFRFLRASHLEDDSALLGAVAFAFSGFMVTHAIHMNFIFVFIWLPLVLEQLERALSGQGLRHALLAALFLGISTMGGYPQYSLYIYYTLALYWLVFELTRRPEGEGRRRTGLGSRALAFGFIVAVSLGLNAVSYLPAAELAGYTPRAEMSYAASVEHSLHPLLLVKLLAPKFFGVQYPELNTYWAGDYSAFWETALFVGVLPLMLALSALGQLRRNRQVLFAALLALIALWLALGRYGLLYRLFFELAPGFDRFRIPGRFSALASLALAVLAAHGWAGFKARARKRAGGFFASGAFRAAAALAVLAVALLALVGGGALDRAFGGALARPEVRGIATGALIRALLTLAAATGLLALAWRVRDRGTWRAAGLAAAAFVFLECYLFGAPFVASKTSPEEVYRRTPLVERFQRELERELFRINARSLQYSGVMLLPRNSGSIHRLFLLEGYNPLQLKRRLGELEDVERRFDLLNVKYEIQVDMQQRQAGFAVNEDRLPRAFLVHRWRVVEDERVLEVLADSGFDCRAEVVLERDPGIDSPPAAGHIEAEAEVARYSQNEIVVRTASGSPGVLVLSEWYFPAWRAWVDGRPVEVLRADHALRAVPLAAGEHEVRFAYRSGPFRLGAALTVSTALLLAGAALALSKRR